MSLKTLTRAGKKALAIAVSAAMVAAFTPVTALGSEEDPGSEAGTAPSAGASLSEEEAVAVADGEYFKVAGISGEPATYYKSTELTSITTGTTITLLDSFTITDPAEVITLPSGVTLNLNNHTITGEAPGATALVNASDGATIVNGTIKTISSSESTAAATDALAITGGVTISGIDASSIASSGSSTLTIKGSSAVDSAVRANLVLSDGALLNASVVYGNATVGSNATLRITDRDGIAHEVGVQGDVTMGASSKLVIIRGNNSRGETAIGLDGDLVMGEDAEGASAEISVSAITSSCAINNSSPIIVRSSQELTAYSYQGVAPDTTYPIIAGDLSVEEGATVSVKSNDSAVYPARYAVGGTLNAKAGAYSGLVREGSTVTGGCFSVDPSSILTEGYTTWYTYSDKTWGYKVVPSDSISDYVTNAYWGTPSYFADNAQTSANYAPYSINFTSGCKSTGSYYEEILKEQEDGSFETIYTSRSFYNRGGVCDYNSNSSFHSALERLDDGEKSGAYKFFISDWDAESGQPIGEGAYSDVYEYTAPSVSLGQATNLHWDSEKPTTACFTLPKGATGYDVTLYLFDTETNRYLRKGGVFSVGIASKMFDGETESSVNFGSYQNEMLTENGTYAFSVRALSFNLDECLDGTDSEIGPGLTLDNIIAPVIDAVKEELNKEGGDNGKTALSTADPSVVGTAMVADDDARETIEEAEEAYKEANNVDVGIESSVSSIDADKVSVVGAAFNATTSSGNGEGAATTVSLQISQVEAERTVTDPSLKSVIQFSMDLVETKADSAEGEGTKLGKTGELDVPVCVTIPVPAGYSNLRIWHYHNDSTEPDVIWPVVFEENGTTYARFYVTSFSDFVFVGEVDDNPNEGGSSEPSTGGSSGSNPGGGTSGTTPGGSNGTGGSAPVATPHEHVFGEGVVTTPATCTAEGVMTYTCTQPGCGETKTEPIPALGHQFGEWTVTTPATTEAEGVETRTCSVCGEAETRSIAKLEAGEPGSGEATPGDDTGSASEQESAKAAVGTTVKISGVTYKVTAAGKVKVTKIAASKKTATLPSTIKVDGKSCKVVGILASALKSAKVTKLIIKSKNLTKKGVKNALKGSKVTTVKVSVSTKKATNQTYIAKYAKYFTKANCGKKVTVK